MPAKPRYRPRGERLRDAERHTLERTPDDSRAAKRTFREGLSAAEQMRLAEEIVETRGAELCRAYRNVIDVSFGFKERRDRRSGKTRLSRTACVIFVVKRKWEPDAEQPAQKLPQHLYAYWTVDGERKLCAVPTDVEDAKRRMGVRPQVGPGVVTVELEGKSGSGVITCAIRRSTFPNAIYAVSCRHVFSLSSATHPVNVTGGIVKAASSGQSFAQTISVKGALLDSPEISLDAQLARVTDHVALDKALGRITLKGFLAACRTEVRENGCGRIAMWRGHGIERLS